MEDVRAWKTEILLSVTTGVILGRAGYGDKIVAFLSWMIGRDVWKLDIPATRALVRERLLGQMPDLDLALPRLLMEDQPHSTLECWLTNAASSLGTSREVNRSWRNATDV